jgi:cephalosporin-C deacetylase-like acetyl esterase
LIQEIESLTSTNLGPQQTHLEMEQLTIMGHGFGGTTAIFVASKDKRIKKVVTFDPWLTPIKEEIESKSIAVIQPHCSINSEMFTNNLEHNW